MCCCVLFGFVGVVLDFDVAFVQFCLLRSLLCCFVMLVYVECVFVLL